MISPSILPGSDAWLQQVSEAIVEPERPIIDPHHHLWREPGMLWERYDLADLRADARSGHRVEKTVFVECHSGYRTDGPGRMKPIGETEYVVERARESVRIGRPIIAGIVGHANLLLGENVIPVLDAHEAAGGGLFRGIRHAGARDTTGTLPYSGIDCPCPYSDASFRKGLRILGRRGHTFDAWHFFHQNREFLDLARSVPDVPIVLDHFGCPLGVGAYAGRREEIFQQWRRDVAAIAECANIYAKLGGLAMPDSGFGWDLRDRPATSDELVEAHRRYYLHTIDCFGPERCMFESNFPVDRKSISYPVLWNAFKKIAAEFSDTEKHALFYGTAARFYRLSSEQ